MRKITNKARASLLIIFLLGSSYANIFASDPKSTALSITESIIHVSCYNETDGSINITVDGGIGIYTYSWSGPFGYFSPLEDIDNLVAGDYTVLASDIGGESISKTFTIFKPEILDANVIQTEITCFQANDGVITVESSMGGYGSYEYSKDNGSTWQASNIFTDVTPGDYTVLIRDADFPSCTEVIRSSLTFIQPSDLNGLVNKTDVSCYNVNDGSITISNPSGGYGLYEYSVDNGSSWQTEGTFNNLNPGNYQVLIRDASYITCTKILDSNLSITQPAELAASVASTNTSCYGIADGSITISSPSGGYGSYQYSINNGSNWQISGAFTNLPPANYQVMIRDIANINCTKVLNPELSISQPLPLNASLASTNITCNGSANGSITITNPTGGYGTYEFSINNGSTWQASGSFVNLSPANYQVIMRDADKTNCTKTLNNNLTLTQPSILNATYTPTLITCYGANDGKIVFSNPSGGNGTYQYSINNGASWENSGVYNNLTNGTYQLLIRDKAHTNCIEVIDANLLLSEPAILFADVTTTDVTCNGAADGNITFSNSSGGYGTYEYSINGNTWQSSNTFNNLDVGIYSVFIRDGANAACKIELSPAINITEPYSLTADVDDTQITCISANDGSITITNPTGGYGLYEYSINGGTSWHLSGDFVNLSPSSYNVLIRDKDNPDCTQILDSAREISEPTVLVSSISTATMVKCKGNNTGSTTVTASGGTPPYIYDWGALGFGESKTGLSAGTYTFIVRDYNGCETAPRNVTITEPATFVEITNISTTTGCYGQNNGTATVTAQGGTGSYTFAWSTGGTGNSKTGLAPGNYWVSATDANGCITQKSFTISAPAQLVINSITSTETTFYGSASGTATVNVSGGTPNYTFLWSNGQTGQVAKNLVAGDYTVTVTDANGCTASGSVTIYDTIEAEISTSAICKNKMDVIRTSYFEAVNTRGGRGTYTYSWNFGTYAIDPIRTGAGKHTVKYNQTGQETITLTITDGFQTVTKTFNHFVVTCYSQCVAQDLKIGDFYIGDALGNRINLTDCQNNPNPPGASIWVEFLGVANRYSLYHEYLFVLNHPDESKTVYEGYYCSPEQIIPTPQKVKIIDISFSCGDSVTLEKIYITVNQNFGEPCNGGADPKCYSISVAANVTTPFYAVATASELLCNGSSDGTISITATGGKKPYNYKVTGGDYQSSNSFYGLEAGSYNLYVKDAENKIFPLISEVTEPTNPLILTEISKSSTTCYGGNDGSATVNASGGTPRNSGDPYIYVWENGQTSATVSNLIAGNYIVKVIDANGCETPLTITITEPAQILADAGPDQTLKCGNNSTFLAADYSGAAPDLGIWTIVNGPAGATITDSNDPTALFSGLPGTYTLRWTVPCGEFDDVKIIISNCNTIDFDGVDDHIDFSNNFNPTGNWAIEAWIKQDATAGSGIKTIMSKRDITNPLDGYELILNNNTPVFKWNNASITSSDAIGTDRWYHIAVVQNDSTRLYVDGIQVAKGTVSTPIINSYNFLIGGVYNSSTPLVPSNYFHGWIEEVRIWNNALTQEQLHFMMNQRITNNSGNVKGVELPLNVPGGLTWNSLDGYYQMEEVVGGLTLGETGSGISGKLINITTTQQRTAPLPYISIKAGNWFTDATWLRPSVWDPPSSNGINGDVIAWNIARISHNINSGGKDISLLGLQSLNGKLLMANPGQALNENNSGQGLTITHYLNLNGNIDLIGDSQLVQSEGSILDDSSSGFIERDQQGTASSYNYNYWSSPVSLQGAPTNSSYSVSDVMRDGTYSSIPKNLDFGNPHTYADGGFTNPRRVSTYWLYKFNGTADEYWSWKYLGTTGTLLAGEGYTMKGTSGDAAITTPQNYVFKGKPNNGSILLPIGLEQNYLVGNPYPSAIDAEQFIRDNLKATSGGTNTNNVFNGALYFWDHFGGKTHNLREYEGGYATKNLLASVPAVSTDERINATNNSGSKLPGKYIPTGQGFFINTSNDIISGNAPIDGGNITFKNGQRAFVREETLNSIFLKPEVAAKQSKQTDSRSKIRLDFKSPKGYNRQILVGIDPHASNGFDLGYDAPLNDYNVEDMFWLIEGKEYVIQGVNNFDPNQVLPLGLGIQQAGDVLIKINALENIDEDLKIYMKDNILKTYHDLRQSDFIIALDPGDYYERFQIVFSIHQSTNPSSPTTESSAPIAGNNGDEKPDSNNLFEEENNDLEEIVDSIQAIYIHPNRELSILNPNMENIYKVVIFNAIGQEIQNFTKIPSTSEIILKIREYPTAVYAVRIYSDKGAFSKNIIFRK